MTEDTARRDAYVRNLQRPHGNLLWLYLLRSLATLCAFPISFLVLYFKWHTLSYRFDDEGVAVSWGILFRQETYLTYKRIQDIHVHQGLFERWLGLGTVDVQTASGSAGAELSLEGLEDTHAVRDFLYARMRGKRGGGEAKAQSTSEHSEGEEDEVVGLLRQIRDDLRGARQALAGREGVSLQPPPGTGRLRPTEGVVEIDPEGSA